MNFRKELGNLMIAISFILVIIFSFVFIKIDNRLENQQTQITKQEETIQRLRNDLVDTQYYYDEYLRIEEIEEKAQDEMISRLFKYVLEEYNGELVESYITKQEIINMIESKLQSYYTINEMKQILLDYDKITYDEYMENNNIFLETTANEINLAFYNEDMSDVIYFSFVIELDEIYAYATYQGEKIFEDIDTFNGTKEDFILELKKEIYDDKIDFYEIYDWYVK